MSGPKIIGREHPLLDALDKANGRTRYMTDLRLDGMVHGAILRSRHAHARIRKLDTARAEALPGVLAVVTPDDAPPRPVPGEPFYGLRIMSRPLFFEEPCWVGAPLCAVVAESAAIARAALELIEVDAEVLPHVLKLEDAMVPDAPEVLTGRRNYALPFGPVHFEQGNVDQDFEDAAYLIEGVYGTSTVQAAAMEPYACIVEPTDTGITIYKGTPAPFELRKQMADWLELDEKAVRVSCPPVGGGFGSRMDDLEFVAALLARKVGRPVRMELKRSEGFLAGRVRHGAMIRVRSALNEDYQLTGREIEAFYDTGGHLDLGPYIILRAMRPLALYPAPNLRFTGALIYTNRPVSGATRGFGNPQATFAIEHHTDQLCSTLGLDPVRFRQQHIIQSGDPNISVGVVDLKSGAFEAKGATISSCALEECVTLVEQSISDPGEEPHGWIRGAGMACAMHTTGKGRKEISTVRLLLEESGAVIWAGAPDQGGTGVATTLAMIAAEILELDSVQIQVHLGDTADELIDSGAHASGRTYVTGTAVHKAAMELKTRRDAGEALPMETTVSHKPESNAPPFAACGAVVDIDPGTGACKVVRIVMAVDAGTIINPLQARGQIHGAVVQGIGFALSERLDFDPEGQLATWGMLDYGVLRSVDVPDIEVHFVGEAEPTHPLGAKGIGEIGLMPVAPAIANAIVQATGISPSKLPITPEDLWYALHKDSLDSET
jgi:CO/xanthine dehydrogenase Mo-binding subunit